MYNHESDVLFEGGIHRFFVVTLDHAAGFYSKKLERTRRFSVCFVLTAASWSRISTENADPGEQGREIVLRRVMVFFLQSPPIPIEKKPLYHFLPGSIDSFHWKFRMQSDLRFLSELRNLPD